MPSLNQIKAFDQTLTTLGNEPEILRSWGEALEPVEPPPEGLSEDLSELLGESGSGDEEDLGELGEFDLEDAADYAEDRPEQEAVEEPVLEGEDFLEAFAGSQARAEAEDELDEGLDLDEELGGKPGELPDEGAEEAGAGQTGAGEPAPDEELPDFGEGWDEFDIDEFVDDLDLDEPEGEVAEPAAEGPAPEEPEEPAPEKAEEPAEELDEFGDLDDLEDLGDLEDFDAGELGELDEDFSFEIDEEEAPPAEGAPVEPAQAGAAPEPSDEAVDGEEELPAEFDLSEDLEEISLGEAEEAEPEEAEVEELSDEMGEEDEAPDDFDLDEFSLGDFGAEFGVDEDEDFEPREEDILPDEALEEEAEEEAAEEREAAAAAAFELSDEQFERMQRTLSRLPLNVKLAAEQAIAEEYGTGRQRQRLAELLVEGESVKSIADFTGRLVGKKLQVPKGYRKLSGLAFEQEKESFAYRFKHQVLPVLRVAMLAAAAVGLLTAAGYQLLYRPIQARNLFRQGYELIPEEQYEQANRLFDQGFATWPVHRWVFNYPVRQWFYRYGEAFTAERQYGLAAQKYEKLLAAYPMDKQGILDYAELESVHRMNYERAEELLRGYQEAVELYDYNILLAAGDNYMRWAEIDEERYEDARVQFATGISRHGDTDELLMRMLLYFIRTDNRQEVEPLRRVFQDDQRTEIDPFTYAELGGYLIDYDDLDEVRDILFRALSEDDEIPEPHYHLARYFRRLESLSEEQRALQNTLNVLDQTEPLTPRRLAMQVDTHGRLGEFYYDREEFVLAEDELLDGIRVYEEAAGQGLLEPEKRFGRLYARLGDIYYYVGREYEAALDQFRRAEANAYSTREQDYKKGYIHYRAETWDDALESFLDAAGPFSNNRNLLYATANAFFNRGNYHSAEGLYRDLLDRLEAEREDIDVLLIEEDPDHRALVEYRIRVRNNLGVTQSRLGEQLGDPDKTSRGMVYLTESNELAENYGRDPETAARAATTSLAELNLRHVLYPRPQYELQIYTAIPRDLEANSF